MPGREPRLPDTVPGMPIVPLGPNGLKTKQLIDQAHGHIIPRPDGQRAQCAGPTGCWTCHLERLVYESKMNLFIDQGMLLSPGDKLLLIAPHEMDPTIVQLHMAKMRARFPDVEVTIVEGFTGVQIAGNQQ